MTKRRSRLAVPLVKLVESGELYARNVRVLRGLGIDTLEPLARLTEDDCYGIEGIGRTGADRIRQALQARGWDFAERPYVYSTSELKQIVRGGLYPTLFRVPCLTEPDGSVAFEHENVWFKITPQGTLEAPDCEERFALIDLMARVLGLAHP